MQTPRMIVTRCPQCGSGMYKQLDSEHREWLVCQHCRAQMPLEHAMHAHWPKPNLVKQNSEDTHA